jgi:hypothetical protein
LDERIWTNVFWGDGVIWATELFGRGGSDVDHGAGRGDDRGNLVVGLVAERLEVLVAGGVPERGSDRGVAAQVEFESKN